MSLLWPDTIHAGLFPASSWLQRNRHPVLQLGGDEPANDGDRLLAAMTALLEKHATSWRKGAELTITVSDGVAAIMALPWQDRLHREAELQAYASACFAQRGVAIDETWVMHTEFRQHGGMGMAYALPRTWLGALLELVQAKGLRLKCIVPVAAAAYCRHPAVQKEELALVLLREACRTSTLIVSRKGLLAYDVEPMIGSMHASTTRLLQRAGSRFGSIRHVYDWSVLAPDAVEPAQLIAQCMPEARLHRLALDRWSR